MSPGTAVAGTWARIASRVRDYRLPLLAFAVALVPRVGFVLHNAGYRGTFRYDPSVYYAASASLLHGRLPYQDYTLLHPPGIVLVLTPFASVGHLTSDHKGFVVATVAFTVLAAINAALVVRLLDVLGCGSRAAISGGLFYAVWVGAVDAEFSIRLEPLGNFLMLCGLLMLAKAVMSGRALTAGAAGAAFGAAASVKIWFVFPLVVIIAVQLGERARRRLAAFVAVGAVAAAVVICGVFFVAAPSQMWSMVVTDHLGREKDHPLIFRLIRMSGVGVFDSHLSVIAQWLAVGLVTAVVLVVCALAWRAPSGRLIVALLVAHITVIAAAPTYFTFYNDFVALPLAVAVGMAVRRRRASTSDTTMRWIERGLAVLGVAAVAASAVMCIALMPRAVKAYPADKLAGAVAGARCVQSDSPMPLIELNVLTRDLRNDCPLWVDVSGRTYNVDAEHSHGKLVGRAGNQTWQRDLTAYLFAGDRVTLFRAHSTGIGPTLRAALRATPVVARSGSFRVYRTSTR